MKRILVSLFIVFSIGIVKAQKIYPPININTGQTFPPGQTEVNWGYLISPTLQGPNPIIINSIASFPGISSVYNGYWVNNQITNCTSNWITAEGTLGNTSPNSNANQQGYIYFFNFDIKPECGTILEASLNFDFIDTDEELYYIRVNGEKKEQIFSGPTWASGGFPAPSPAPIPPLPLNFDLLKSVTVPVNGTLVTKPLIGPGVPYSFEISTLNTPSTNPSIIPGTGVTALQVCGNISVTCCNSLAPFNLQSVVNQTTGNIDLSWSDNALYNDNTYEIEIFYNDPSCPPQVGTATTQIIDVESDMSYSFTPPADKRSFSWRVRAKCNGQTTWGDWSSKKCEYIFVIWTPPLREKGSAISGEIEETEITEITILPNPTFGIINIQAANFEKFEYQVSDFNGKLIIKRTAVNSNTLQVDLRNQPNGMYFVTIESNGKAEILKLLKQD